MRNNDKTTYTAYVLEYPTYKVGQLSHKYINTEIIQFSLKFTFSLSLQKLTTGQPSFIILIN